MLNKVLLAFIFITVGFVSGSLYATSSNNHQTLPISDKVSNLTTTEPTEQENLQQLLDRVQQLENAQQQDRQRYTALEISLNDLSDKMKQILSNTAPNDKLPVHQPATTDVQSPSKLSTATNTFFEAPDQAAIEQNLISYGFNPQEIQQLQRKQDQQQLDQLYLRDQAIREGWVDSERYREARKKLTENNSLREELGDERYDLYLYASEQQNRLVVEETMLGSAAESAGLLPGDYIISYANQRIFNWSELRQATLQGQANESITVQVERDGQRVFVSLPRGPLGVRLNMTRVEP